MRQGISSFHQRISLCIMVLFSWVSFLRYFVIYSYPEQFGIPLNQKLLLHVMSLWTVISVSAGSHLSHVMPKMFEWMIIVFSITEKFRIFKKDFQNITKPDFNIHTPYREIEYWMCRHMQLYNLVKIIDHGFGAYILLVFVSVIPICCFIIYALLMVSYDDPF